MIYDKLYQDIIAKVSEELQLPKEVVLVAYRSQWEFIKEHIESLPLKGGISEEEFNELQVSFNIPSLGKLYTTYDRVTKMNKRFELIQNIKK